MNVPFVVQALDAYGNGVPSVQVLPLAWDSLAAAVGYQNPTQSTTDGGGVAAWNGLVYAGTYSTTMGLMASTAIDGCSMDLTSLPLVTVMNNGEIDVARTCSSSSPTS